MNLNQLYIITGASKGIGLGLVRHLLEKPDVQIIGISRSATGISDSRLTEFRCDLRDPSAIEHTLESIFPDPTGYASIILVNNAGSIGEIAHLGSLSPKSIHQVLALNAIAPAILMNAFLSKYSSDRATKRVIVNISSGAATKAIDGWSIYSSSKAAVNALSQTAQKEADLTENGIRIISLAPGVVDTDMQSLIRVADRSSFSEVERFREMKEQKRLSSPEQIAKKLVYLVEHIEDYPDVIQDLRNL